MSLLLDALKKAADEKRKFTDGAKVLESKSIDIKIENEANAEPILEKKGSRAVTKELTLESIDNVKDLDSEEYKEVGSAFINNTSLAQNMHVDARKNKTNRDDYNVSDEALGLLIYKTNRDYKKNKILLVTLITILSLIILITGGLYFLQTIKKDVNLMERRHSNAMRMVRKKTGEEKLPGKTKVINNIISDSKIKNKTVFASQRVIKKHPNSGHVINQKNKQIMPDKKRQDSLLLTRKNNKKISIQKGQSVDLVSMWLDNAWLKYEKGDFIQAKDLYKKVLIKEENNRDALLGLGAIAIRENAGSEAQKYYFELLKLNPDDPDAIAALTSMIQPEQLEESEQKIKELLNRNTSSAPLHFTLGNIYAAQKRWKAAQAAYFDAWVNDKNNPVYTFNLAVSLDQLGKISEAERFYHRSLRLAINTNPGFSKQSVLTRLKQMNATGAQ